MRATGLLNLYVPVQVFLHVVRLNFGGWKSLFVRTRHNVVVFFERSIQLEEH